ncbi:DUF3885 domain-containing protein [Bacillus solimangrovi]|nr:DUF3885 domain-containing protein [Bacillus solimangrovi]
MNSKEKYIEYMDNQFPSILKFPFRIQKNLPWLRFELGIPGEWRVNQDKYIDTALQKAITLFETTHSKEDEILLLVVDYVAFNKKNQYKKTKVFERYLKDKTLVNRLHMITNVSNDHDLREEWKSYSYIVQCKVSQLKIQNLLRAISHNDFVKQPYVSQSCYIINTSTNTIFHMYDDRGLDLFANDIEEIRPVYDQYSEWILDYDRKEIDEYFGKGLIDIEETNLEKNSREQRDEKLLEDLETKNNIEPEFPHKPVHMFEVNKESVSIVKTHLTSMGYDVLVNKVNEKSKQLITCRKPCQLYQYQVSIQTHLMALVAKKYDITYIGWDI